MYGETITDTTRAVLRQQRQDLAWLECELLTNEAAFALLKGNYVAVHNARILAVSEDREIALLGANRSLDDAIDKKDILVVPVCVPDTESEDEWQAVKVRLGMTS